MTNRTPPELVQQIRKLRADGVTLREIVELTGVCATTAMKLTADMENVRRLAPRVSREQIERMQMLRREGLSRPEISAECGISLTTVRRHTAGIQPEGRKLLKEKIRQLYLEGKTYAQIEEETGAGSWRVATNNDTGRQLFKADLVSLGNQYQDIGAISDFESADIEIDQGAGKRDVAVASALKPNDSMEKLYMTVHVA